MVSQFSRCCWYHKGTNFQANHNNALTISHSFLVVADTTKVRIFKQITTEYGKQTKRQQLLLIPQRYEFSSKSQQPAPADTKPVGCCWYHKGTNFQANHNECALSILTLALLLIPQRYEFSSKSQHIRGRSISKSSCCWYHKGTNFQANHNGASNLITTLRVVADTTKVRIFKQITTCCH